MFAIRAPPGAALVPRPPAAPVTHASFPRTHARPARAIGSELKRHFTNLRLKKEEGEEDREEEDEAQEDEEDEEGGHQKIKWIKRAENHGRGA